MLKITQYPPKADCFSSLTPALFDSLFIKFLKPPWHILGRYPAGIWQVLAPIVARMSRYHWSFMKSLPRNPANTA
jgi:hypothetical protein